MTNIILKKWDLQLEIISKPSVLQMDQILILYRKYNAFVIWELELTLAAAKILLVDKTKEVEIDKILKWEFWDWTADIVDEWWGIVFEIITKAQEAKKKSIK